MEDLSVFRSFRRIVESSWEKVGKMFRKKPRDRSFRHIVRTSTDHMVEARSVSGLFPKSSERLLEEAWKMFLEKPFH